MISNQVTGLAIVLLLRKFGAHRVRPMRADSVVDGLIGRGPEVEADVRRAGGRPGRLGQEDGNQVLVRVRSSRRAQAAVPTERSDGPGHVVAPGDYRNAESPAVAVEVAAYQSRHRLLRGG